MFERVMASFISSSMASMTIAVSLYGWSWEEGVQLTSITCCMYFLLFFGISFPLLLLFGPTIVNFAEKDLDQSENTSTIYSKQMNLAAYLIVGVLFVFLIWSGIIALDWIGWIMLEISKDYLFVITFGMVETTLMFYFVAVLTVQLVRFAHVTQKSVYGMDGEAKKQQV